MRVRAELAINLNHSRPNAVNAGQVLASSEIDLDAVITGSCGSSEDGFLPLTRYVPKRPEKGNHEEG